MALYYQPANALLLRNDAGTDWLAGALGSGGALQNRQCAIALDDRTTATAKGPTLTLTLAMTFSPAFAGAEWGIGTAGGYPTPRPFATSGARVPARDARTRRAQSRMACFPVIFSESIVGPSLASPVSVKLVAFCVFLLVVIRPVRTIEPSGKGEPPLPVSIRVAEPER